MFVGAESAFQTIDEIVAEGKKRKLNVGTSRIAHPASIGILAPGEATGASFNLVPLCGGKNTVAGAVTGEMDLSVLTSGTVAAAGEAVRTLLVFNDTNLLGEALDDAPTMNAHFGTELPPMLSARAFAIHSAAIAAHPERFEMQQTTFQQAFDDPDLRPAIEQAGGYWAYVSYGGVEERAEYTRQILEIGERFKAFLTGDA